MRCCGIGGSFASTLWRAYWCLDLEQHTSRDKFQKIDNLKLEICKAYRFMKQVLSLCSLRDQFNCDETALL